MVNFRQPYLASSLQDFWRRWHISLSTWLRDYLYISLGGNRGSESATYRNLLLTMLIGSFWHGANWTFLIWGTLHGGYWAAERYLKIGQPNQALILWVRRALVFHLVVLAWVFFRAESVGKAFAMLSPQSFFTEGPVWIALLFVAIHAIPMLLLDLYLEKTGEEYPMQQKNPPWKLAMAFSLVILTLLFSGNQISAFIYFQF